jgi:hypothetical protein
MFPKHPFSGVKPILNITTLKKACATQSGPAISAYTCLPWESPWWRQVDFDVANAKALKMTAARTHGKTPADKAGCFQVTTKPNVEPFCEQCVLM